MPNWLELAMGLNWKGKSIYETETVRTQVYAKVPRCSLFERI